MQKKQLSNYPVWFDGTNINEAAFCEEFLHTHKILFANNAFFTCMIIRKLIITRFLSFNIVVQYNSDTMDF